MDELTPNEFMRVIRADPNLSQEHKELIERHVYEPTFFKRLIYGGLGAGLANLIAKYFALGKTSKVLVTMAGFGIGELVLLAIEQDKDNKVRYNKQTALYELK